MTDARPARIEVLPTPNPDARMLRVEELLVPTGTWEYKLGDDTSGAPLARALLAVDGCVLILIAPRFVTVRKRPDDPWEWLQDDLEAAFRAFLDSGEMAVLDEVLDEVSPAGPVGADAHIIAQIQTLLDEEIRPAVAQDGGDVQFEGFREGTVYLKLIGSCGSCPSSVTTLKMGIERLLVEEIAEVERVVNVDQPAA
jgi:Fe-S cluster biogenesis protein NfuA